jgi:hypothetical protein
MKEEKPSWTASNIFDLIDQGYEYQGVETYFDEASNSIIASIKLSPPIKHIEITFVKNEINEL